jgi:hypothetical protein
MLLHRCSYTEMLSTKSTCAHRCLDIFTQTWVCKEKLLDAGRRRVYTQLYRCLYTEMVLHTGAFTHQYTNTSTQWFLHKSSFTQGLNGMQVLLHRGTLTHSDRWFYTQILLHGDVFAQASFFKHTHTCTHAWSFTGMSLNAHVLRRLSFQNWDTFTQRCFHTEALTHTETLLHTNTFTQRWFYIEEL